MIPQHAQINPMIFQNPILMNAIQSSGINPMGVPSQQAVGQPHSPHPMNLQPFPMHSILLPTILQAQIQAQMRQPTPNQPAPSSISVENSSVAKGVSQGIGKLPVDSHEAKSTNNENIAPSGDENNAKDGKVEGAITNNLTSFNLATEEKKGGDDHDVTSEGIGKSSTPSQVTNDNNSIAENAQPTNTKEESKETTGLSSQENTQLKELKSEIDKADSNFTTGQAQQLDSNSVKTSPSLVPSSGGDQLTTPFLNQSQQQAQHAALIQGGLLPGLGIPMTQPGGQAQVPGQPQNIPPMVPPTPQGVAQQLSQIMGFMGGGGGSGGIEGFPQFFPGLNLGGEYVGGVFPGALGATGMNIGGINGANAGVGGGNNNAGFNGMVPGIIGSGIGGGCLLENDLERLHSHAESLVKTLLDTSIPKSGIRLRLEWDRRRYCFKFTVYQIEEVRDSLGYQKKRLIPIDQDELFVNVNASKQLSIDNVEKAMWSAFVSVRHTLAKYCDRQAGQRRQSGAGLNSNSSGRSLGSNSLVKLDEGGLISGIGGKVNKSLKKDEQLHGGLMDLKKYIPGSVGGGLISDLPGIGPGAAGLGGKAYNSDPYSNNMGGIGSAGGASIGGNHSIGTKGRRGYGADQEYVGGRKGRGKSSKYGSGAVGGGSSSGEDEHGIASGSVSNNNKYAKTYLTNSRGSRRGGNGAYSSGNNTSTGGMGVYRTRGSGLSLSDNYDSLGGGISVSTNVPIFVLQKDDPNKKSNSLVGLYAEWVDKNTIWDVRKGPFKTVFVSESIKDLDYSSEKRETLKFTTNNYLKWDPSHLITDLRGIHIPLSLAGKYFGLLRNERTKGDKEDERSKVSMISDQTCDVSTVTHNDQVGISKEEQLSYLDSNIEMGNKLAPITIKGNHVPNANQIRFIPNDESFKSHKLFNNNLVGGEKVNNENQEEFESKLLESKLLELEAVDSVLVSTIQTTAALEQRKKRENKNSCISVPTGSFLIRAFYNSTNEDENSSVNGGNSGNGIEHTNHLIIFNNEELEEYKHLTMDSVNATEGTNDHQSKNSVSQTITTGTGKIPSRGIKRRGSLKNQTDITVNGGGVEANSASVLEGGSSCRNTTDDHSSSMTTISGTNINSNSGSSSSLTTPLNNSGGVLGQHSSNNNSGNGISSSYGGVVNDDTVSSGGAIAVSAMLEGLITSVRGSSGDKYRQQQLMQAYPQNRFVSKKKCRETNEILAKYVNDLASEYCHRNFGSSNLADGYINAFNSHVLKNFNK
ncbi:hypothetical protein CmeUKMEL1_05090 [Cryptosporidium meleagridis]|uniref:Uncharacterized protein n=1 Tax=Cryptosporidium meleagridis TaxID=93969 RepID=A0A2P4YYU1_9CRYT|nr:hypothetical protein CmeUKMEL1_05090 [Cryptosporidium meleagridis]